jgi:uncharacterized protein (TIGR02444 family)
VDEIPPEALWHEITALYEEPGVAVCCLQAQDEAGVDVLLVLLAAALARRGFALADPTATALCARAESWQREVVHPLRVLRRQWRARADMEPLREALKDLELAAEKKQLFMLAGLIPPMAAAVPAAPALLEANIAAVLPRSACERYLPPLLAVLGEGWRPDAAR